MRLDYFSVGTAICFALDVAAVGIGPFGYIIQIVFVDFRDAASHGAIAQVPAEREAVESEALTGNLIQISAKVFNADYAVTQH